MLFAPSFRSLTMKNKADLCRHLSEPSLSCALPFIMTSSAPCCLLALPGHRTYPQMAHNPFGFKETAGLGKGIYSVLFPRVGITPASGCHAHKWGSLGCFPAKTRFLHPRHLRLPLRPPPLVSVGPLQPSLKRQKRSQKYQQPFSSVIRGDQQRKEAPDRPVH